MLRALLLCLLLVNAGTWAADVPFTFDDPAEAARYEALIAQLRCLVCQNQSLADSHADLAQDLRNEVYRMIRAGMNDREIIDFLVERYGDFVLYSPPLKATTWALWFGPFVLLLVVAIAWRRVARSAANEAPPLSDDEQRRLAELSAPRPRNPT